MSNRKKALFIALGSLMALSTGFALLGAHALTSEANGAPDQQAGAAATLPDPSSAQVAWDPFYLPGREAGCAASTEGGCQLIPLAWRNDAPLIIDAERPFETYSALSDGIESIPDAGLDFGYNHRQLMSDLNQQFSGAYLAALASQLPSIASRSRMSGINSLVSGASGSGSSDDSSGSTPGDDAAGSVPGDDAAGSVPGDDAAGSTPADDAPGSAPGDDVPGSTPGNDSPGSVPGDDAPGTTPGNDLPGTLPGPDSPIGGGPVTTVPEPGSMGLLALGLTLLAVGSRRRRASI